VNGIENFKQKLARHKTFGLDTPCFVYHFEANPTYFDLTQELFHSLETRFAVTSTLTLAEILGYEQVYYNKKVWVAYKNAFLSAPNLSILVPNLIICEKAAGLRVKYKIGLADAVLIATTTEVGASVFVTNDKILRKVKELEVLILDDFLIR